MGQQNEGKPALLVIRSCRVGKGFDQKNCVQSLKQDTKSYNAHSEQEAKDNYNILILKNNTVRYRYGKYLQLKNYLIGAMCFD